MNKEVPATPWLVVIDRAVRDWRRLRASAPRGEPILLLEPQQNGLEQIDSFLRRAPCNSYCGIAVVGEATAARLQLGNGALDGDALERHAPLLQRWQHWLQPGAGLRLYGCRLAAGSAGRALLQRLSEIAGLSAAASARPVGPAALGGSTSLEQATGAIAAAPAWLEAALAQQLGHVLGEEPQLAVLHAGDPAFLTPINGQLQLPDGDGLNVAALQSDHDATAGANDAWLISTELGSFHFWADGRWSYAANPDPEFEWANRGSNNDLIGTDYILLATTAGSSVALRIDVLAGDNDAPVLDETQPATGAVSEQGSGIAGASSTGGQLSASDADAYAPLRWQLRSQADGGSAGQSITSQYGAFTISANGAWSYSLNDNAPATQALSSGESVTDTVLAVVVDEFGASASQTLSVTISGSDDVLTGVVIDGYIEGAWVFVDLNENRQHDNDEPISNTQTDANGTFTLAYAGYEGIEGAVLVAYGGTDVTTRLPFRGTLMAPLDSVVISPLSTVVVALLAAEGGPATLVEAEELLASSLGLVRPPEGFDAFDPFLILNGQLVGDAALALDVQIAAAQVAAVLNTAAAFDLQEQAVLAQLADAILKPDPHSPLNLASSDQLARLLVADGGSAPVPSSVISELAAANTAAAQATDLDALIEAQIQADSALPALPGGSGGSSGTPLPPAPTAPPAPPAPPDQPLPSDPEVETQELGQAIPFPTVLGNRRSNRLLGSNGNDVIRGFGLDDPSRGRKQKDKLTGLGGSDLFQLGDDQGAFYNRPNTRKAGRGDYAWITDFSKGDQIQLYGDPARYLLRQVTFKKQQMTAIYLNDGSGKGANPNGWDKRDELIGVVQQADDQLLNLLDAGQFFYVRAPVPTAGAP